MPFEIFGYSYRRRYILYLPLQVVRLHDEPGGVKFIGDLKSLLIR